MNSYRDRQEQKQTICAGTSCSSPANYQLSIMYLNRIGWFCGKCKIELVKEGLAMEIKDE